MKKLILAALLATSSPAFALPQIILPGAAGIPSGEHEAPYKCINDGRSLRADPNFGRCKAVFPLTEAGGPFILESVVVGHYSGDSKSSVIAEVYYSSSGPMFTLSSTKNDFTQGASQWEDLVTPVWQTFLFNEGAYAVVEVRGDTRIEKVTFNLSNINGD